MAQAINTAPVEGLDPGKDASYQIAAIVLGALTVAVPVLLVVSLWIGDAAPIALLWRAWPLALLLGVYLLWTIGRYTRYRRRYGATPRRFRVEYLRTEMKGSEGLRHIQWKPFEEIPRFSESWWAEALYDIGDGLVEWWIRMRKGPALPPVERPPDFPVPPPYESPDTMAATATGGGMPGGFVLAQIALAVAFVLLVVLLVGSL